MPSDLFDQLARLGDRLDQEATEIALDEVTDRAVPAPDPSLHRPAAPFRPQSWNSTEVELEMDTPTRTRITMGSRSRIGLVVAAVGVAATVIAVALVSSSHETKTVPAVPTSTTPVATSTVTTIVGPTDQEIAHASLLNASAIGNDYVEGGAGILTLDFAVASKIPSCASYLDTVFESPRRPATVSTQGFSKIGAGFNEYVAVFPTEEAAATMMGAIKDPGFGSCLATFSAAEINALVCCKEANYRAVAPMVLQPVGDDVAVISLEGSVVDASTSTRHEDNGPWTFMRVGRAVVSFNPVSSPNWYTDKPGYPESRVQQILAVAAGRLALIQHLN